AGDVSTATQGPKKAKVWVLVDSGQETVDSFSATGGFLCTEDTLTLAPTVIIECTGDLGPGAGVAVTVNTTETASSGDTLVPRLNAAPLDELTQFPIANDIPNGATKVVGQ